MRWNTIKRPFVVFILMVFSLTLSANPLARIYQVDDPVLKQIEELSWESGINPFIPSGPISGYELARHVDTIDSSKLSPHSRKQLDVVESYIHDPFGGKLFDYSISATLEGYANTNDEAKYYDWVEGYVKRSPLLRVEAETLFGSSAYGIFTYALPKGFNSTDFNGFSTNSPFFLGEISGQVQNSVPHTAFLGFSHEWFTLVFGRDSIRLGRGNTGNLMLNDNGPYNDFFSLSLANKGLKYTLTVVPLDEIGEDGKLGIHGSKLFFDTNRRTYISHRLALDFFPTWRVAITEGVLFYSESLDLRMFNPLMLLHNLQTFKEVNNSIGLESELTLSKHWVLNAQVMMDQIQTAAEQDASGTLPPNAYGFLLGGRFGYPIGNWKIKGHIEGVYTSPYLYLRAGDGTEVITAGGDDSEKIHNLDFINAVRMADKESGISWLGYPDGPDSIIFNTKVIVDYQDVYSFFSSVKVKVAGERGMKIWGDKKQEVDMLPPEEINTPSPSGDNPLYTLTIGLGGSVKLFDTKVEVGVRNYLVNQWDNTGYRADNQLTFGISYTF